MNYVIIFSVIFVLGLLTLRMWFWGYLPGKLRVEEWQKAASQYIALGQWEAAFHKLRHLHRRRLGGVKTYVLYAQVLRGIQRPDEALSIIEEGLSSSPDHLDLIHQKGKVLLDLGRAPEALDHLSRCHPIFHGEEDHLDYASALYRAGHIEEAWGQIASFVSHSLNGRLFALAADIYYHWKQYNRALRYYFRAQYCGWKTHPMMVRTGFCLFHCGKLDAAERIFHKLLVYDSSDVASTLGLGAVLEAKRLWGQALVVYQGGKCWESCHGKVLRQAGLCALMTKQWRFAELYFKAAIDHGEDSPKTLSYLAYCLECQRQWSAAEKVYKLIIEKHPDHVAGYRGVAWLFGVGLSNTVDAEMGLAMARQAIKRTPDAVSWELLSACEARAGNFTRAHDIQEKLSCYSVDETTRKRRASAMRTLRRGQPLDENLVCSTLVA